jgi:dUTP pyrophosphatase
MSAAEIDSGLTLAYWLSPDASGLELRVPRDQDAGFDLPALEEVVIPAGKGALVRTGVHMAIPVGWVGLLRDRSSMALRGALVLAGVIDSSYRGEVKVAMHNLSKEPLRLARGERIAQCVVVPHLSGTNSIQCQRLEQLGSTERGAGGFGSTGR